MNWTGGRLSRHSRRDDRSTISKQKQHFAKMRTHLLSGSVKKCPAKRPNFDMAAPQPSDELSVTDGAVTTEPQQPLAPFGHDIHTYHGLQGGNRHPGREENSRYGQEDYTGWRNVSQSSSRSYEAKSKPISTIEPVNGDYEEQDDMGEIRRKRFRILREGDWLGLSIQRPLQLEYMESENRDAIGKRRILSDGYEARYSRVQDKIASPFAPNRHIPSGDIFLKPGQNQPQILQYGQTPGTKGSVRIFIDGRERNVVESSGSVMNRPHPEYVQSSASSDVMLLDLEGGGSRPRPPHQLNLDVMNGNGCIPESLEHGRRGSEEKSMSSMGDYPSSGPLTYQMNGLNRSVYAPSLQQQSSQIPAMNRTNPRWPNASPVVYQPTPRCSTTSRLLRSNSSIFDGSVAATAGRKGTVAASVAQDEKMWRSWLITEGDEESPSWPVEDQSDELASGSNISGRDTARSVLARLSSADQSGLNDEFDHGRELLPSVSNHLSPATGSLNDGKSGNNITTPSLGTMGTSKARRPERDDAQLPTKPQEWNEEEKNQDAAWKEFVPTEAIKNLPTFTVEPPKKVAQEDPDAAWKKFVLSSDSDDEGTASSTDSEESERSTSRKRAQGSYSKISLRVHPAETVVHSESRLDDSSDMASDGVGFSETSLHTNSSARETSRAPTSISQVTGRHSEGVVSKQRNTEDPLARYMPKPLQSHRDIIMTNDVQLTAINGSFERGLDDSLKQALHLGRRYAKQEKERYLTQGKERYVDQENARYVKQKKKTDLEKKRKETRDIYDIPISDDIAEVDGEQTSRHF